MPLLLTQFHLYCKITILQDLYHNTVEMIKMRKKETVIQILYQRSKQRPTPMKNQGRALKWEGPKSTQEPTTRRRSRAGPTWVRPHPSATTWVQLPPTDAWRHAMVVQGSVLIYQGPADLHASINVGIALSFNTHIICSYTSLPRPVLLLSQLYLELAKLSRRAWLLGRRVTSWYE